MFLVALSILPCLVMVFYRRPLLLLYLWPISILLDTILVESTLGVEGIAQGSIWLLPMDPVYFFTILHLALYAVLQPKRFTKTLRENPFLSIFVVIVAFCIIIYTPMYGKRAIGEGRKLYFMFLFPLLVLVAMRKHEDLRRFVQVFIVCAVFAALYNVVLAAMHGTIVRVVNSECTLIIAFAAFAMLIYRLYKIVVFHPVVDRLLLLLFAALTIGSGQRSVWLAVGQGLLLLTLLYMARRTLMAKIVVAAVAFVVVLGTSFVYFPQVGITLGQKFEGILNPSSDPTASWRIEGWDYQLERLKNSGRLLFGEGFGGYYSWEFEGTLLRVSPHNGYIQMALKLGLLGLAIYSLLAVEFFRRAAVFRKTLSPGPMKAYLDMGIVNFGAGHAYMLGYGIFSAILVFFAVALCAIKLSENFQEVTTTSPALARRPKRVGWPTAVPAADMRVPNYER